MLVFSMRYLVIIGIVGNLVKRRIGVAPKAFGAEVVGSRPGQVLIGVVCFAAADGAHPGLYGRLIAHIGVIKAPFLRRTVLAGAVAATVFIAIIHNTAF